MTSSSTTMTSSNAGGVGAKAGFLFQDYAAALYVTQMLSDTSLLAVRCEVTDDIDLIFNDHEEFVQVKTTDGESKWTFTEVCAVTKVKKVKGKPKPPPSNDSIIHKSMLCKGAGSGNAKFRLLSLRDVRKELLFLRTTADKRTDPAERKDFISSLESRMGAYVTPNGLGVEEWVDNAYWEVVPSLEVLELRARNAILKAAFSKNVVLESEVGDQIILNAILAIITKKSALSRTIHTADQKTYGRKEFLEWFNKEILLIGEQAAIYQKVYFNATQAKSQILIKFIDLGTPKKQSGMALGQGYERGKYRYRYIAESIIEWLPEILLRPSELADNTGKSVLGKVDLISGRLKKETPQLIALIGRVLMHSALRTFSNSQPIPATLYIDGGCTFNEFENIHIVNGENGDELWLGLSEFSESEDLPTTIKTIAEKLHLLISNDFGKQRRRILDIKEDTYLLHHDIDALLNESTPIDNNIDRFRFVIFLGYKSPHFSVDDDLKRSNDHHAEAQSYFQEIISAIIAKDPFFDQMSFFIYLFPNPCINTLQQSVADKLQETKYV
jgi:hypothetical protein